MKPKTKYCPCCGGAITWNVITNHFSHSLGSTQADCNKCDIHTIGRSVEEAKHNLVKYAASQSLGGELR